MELAGQAVNIKCRERRRILVWLYAPWAWLVYVPAVGIMTLFWGLAAWIIAHVNQDLGSACSRPWGRILCWLNFTRVSTRGAEHVERSRAYIVMSNHQSHFDVLATASHSPVPVRWVMKEELRRVPILGSACAKVGMVFIDRRDRGRAIASLRAPSTRAMVGRGISLFFFPEGTRSSDGQLGSFKKGGFMAALELGLPILPMTISGSGRVLPARGLRILPGSITLTIHPPVMASDYGLERRDELMRDVRAAIAAGLREQQ